MLKTNPEILKYCRPQDFIDTYIKESGAIPPDFMEEVGLFKIRANLSIAAYLIKVGKGQSREMEELISRCVKHKFVVS